MINRSLKQYELLEKLGEGGMGVVYKARDTVLGRDAAIKILHPDKLQHENVRTRFYREARTASALNHPNIITIYEIGLVDGIDYIAMEYVRGRSLWSILRDRPMSIQTAIAYALQIADALVKAHAEGIVHRDLKPGNLMVTDDGLLKVLDFGLARLQPGSRELGNDSSGETAGLTVQGTVMGTVAYMSPEQARGEEVDARSDIFSFGIMLFEMISGELPFAGSTEMGLLHNLHFNEPKDLSVLRPSVPPGLHKIVRRMLEKPLERRYQSINEVRQDLRNLADNSSWNPAWMDAETILDVAAPRAVKPRRTSIMLVGTIVVALLIVFIVAFMRPRTTANTPAVETIAAEAKTPYDGYVQARALLDRFDRDGNVDRAIKLLQASLEKDPNYALGYATLAEAYRYRYRLSPDPQWLKLMDQSATRALELNPDLAAAHIAMALARMEDAAGASEAEKHLRQAIDLDPKHSAAHKWLGVLLSSHRDFAKAAESLNTAAELDPKNWTPLLEIGLVKFQTEKYNDAAAAWERARDLTPDNLRVLSNLAAVYTKLDRYEDAASTLQRAIEIHPDGQQYANLGTLRFFQGRYSDSVPVLEKAVELIPNRYKYWGNLGDAYRWSPGNKAKAPGAYLRGIQLLKDQIASKPGDADLRSTLVLYYAKSGDFPTAKTELAKLGAERIDSSAVLFKMAVGYEICGMRDKALESLQRSIRAGYSEREIRNEPEFLSLREDVRYHRMLTKP